MGRKEGKYKRKESTGPTKKKAIPFNSDDEDMMNDEIDAFHKQRDVVPMRLDEDMEESDEDGEQSVFNIEDEDDDDEEEDAEIDNPPPKGFEANARRTQKYMTAKFGGVEDEIFDDAHEEEHEKVVWGGTRYNYGADVVDEIVSKQLCV